MSRSGFDLFIESFQLFGQALVVLDVPQLDGVHAFLDLLHSPVHRLQFLRVFLDLVQVELDVHLVLLRNVLLLADAL